VPSKAQLQLAIGTCVRLGLFSRACGIAVDAETKAGVKLDEALSSALLAACQEAVLAGANASAGGGVTGPGGTGVGGASVGGELSPLAPGTPTPKATRLSSPSAPSPATGGDAAQLPWLR
jgi:hypothetical protein